MEYTFKCIFYKKTKDTTAWYVRFGMVKGLPNTVVVHAVDNLGKPIDGGAILDIHGTKGIRTHMFLTDKLGIAIGDNHRVNQYSL